MNPPGAPPGAGGAAPPAVAAGGAAGNPAPPAVGGVAPQVPPLPVLPATTHPYLDMYADTARDPFVGHYPAIYAQYDINALNTPAVVRDRILTSGSNGTPICEIALTRTVATAAADPGVIQGYHRICRYPQSLVNATPFDGVGYAFMGDIQDGQHPHMVVWRNTMHHQTGDTQVPTADYMDQLLAADPTLETVGPFAAGTNDTEGVNTRNSVFLPQRFMNLFMNQSLTPRQAWNVLRPAVAAQGLAVECEPLIDWLRVALTRRVAGGVSALSREAPESQAIATPAEAIAFRQFGTNIINTDHPNLRTNQMTQGALLVSQGLTSIAEQTRLQREADEQRRRTDTNKTPSTLFSTGLPRLMRWCQVNSEAQLPTLYTLAANAKKGERRRLLQDQIADTMEALNYRHDFPISTKLANRIFDLEWASRDPENFSLGISIFTTAWVPPSTAESRRERNLQADTVYAGHTQPSLSDAESILDSSEDFNVPMTFSQLGYCVEQSHATWHTLLGPGHPLVAAHLNYRNCLREKQVFLEISARPRNPDHAGLVPCLLARMLQIQTNVWLRNQSFSPANVQVPDLLSVFQEIELMRDWAPSLPRHYFPTLPPVVAPSHAPSTGSQSNVSSLTAQTIGAPPPAVDAEAQTMLRQPAQEAFAGFQAHREKAIKTSDFKAYMRLHNKPWPTTPSGKKFCVSWHVKGVCNSKCGFKSDHCVHTAADDTALLAWLDEHYKIE